MNPVVRTKNPKKIPFLSNFSPLLYKNLLLRSLHPLSSCEKAHPNLPHVEVDELATLVCDVSPEVPPDEAVPNGGVHLLKGLADGCSNLLLCVVGTDGFEGDLGGSREVGGGGGWSANE